MNAKLVKYRQSLFACTTSPEKGFSAAYCCRDGEASKSTTEKPPYIFRGEFIIPISLIIMYYFAFFRK